MRGVAMAALALAVVLAGCARDSYSTSYPDVVTARQQDAVDRGWIPALLPEEASDLREVHAPADDTAVVMGTLPGGILPDDCTETAADIGQPALHPGWLPDDVDRAGNTGLLRRLDGHGRRPHPGALDGQGLGGRARVTPPVEPVGSEVGEPDTDWYRSAIPHARLVARVGFSIRESGGHVVHRWGRLLLIALAVVVGAVALTACGGNDSDAASSDPTYVTIGMLDNLYTRDVTRIPAGGTVRFANDGDTIHNAIAADGSWSTEQVTGEAAIQPGERVEVTVDEPGVYTFYCSFHATQDSDGNWQGMVATLVVGDVEYNAATGGEPIEPVEEWTGTTRRVPDDYPTIQNAVDAAEPGDLVLVDRGVYREQVDVTTPYITIRGVDRQDVVIDGEFTRANGINVAAADGVAVENLTVRNTTVNGLFFTGLTGYRASYVTATNNGVYGIYSFDAQDGLFEHDYASGSPDAGFYIGQCRPCSAVIRDVVAEWNGLGYSGTNASGDLYIVDSEWRDNVGGIVPNTLDTELKPPVEDVTIIGNLVHDNDNPEAPALSGAWGSFGAGITVAGGNDSLVARNRVVNHARTGIFITPNSSKRFWMARGNEVRDNVVAGSGIADITFSGVAQGDNCFEDNDVRTTAPPGLQAFYGCSGLRLPLRYDVSQMMVSLGRVAEASGAAAARVDVWKTAPAPAAAEQPDMPGGADATVQPAYRVMDHLDLDLDQIGTPELPDDLDVTQTKVLTMAGIPVFASAFGTFYGLYAFILPFALYAAWIALAAWDLSRREDISRGAQVGWVAVILLVPFLGPVLYYVLGRSQIPAHLRWSLVAGGFVAYAATFAIGAVVGGVI